ncbi:Vitamin B12 import ATP-binding protein BtuD [Sporomusa silvacetica DSM 10669]|uniref:Vitamin B12 import ATP-binding protein BtuD n=1 Tax=Sporomusa silvacetica DSM 10669 TaxID=1123289 RepID=A0ABZ3IVN9_9FIRM|nr:ABC transporter ATP-binding protein [Sporomusa silvacetica]OZC15179.1 macrolide export ATP-binding/permease protein MacB [Sporomusa silvacetica DSM 10669]
MAQNVKIREIVKDKTIAEIITNYPVVQDFFLNYNLQDLQKNLTVSQALEKILTEQLEEFGLDVFSLTEELVKFMATLVNNREEREKVQNITIIGGRNKQGEAENVTLTMAVGEVISIVGPTGSGKSRLLGDIECLAQCDTPTRRQILINDHPLSDEERFDMGNKMVAQLSQNMNFVMDLNVAEFLAMHAKSRLCENSEQVIKQCFVCANELAGEKFTMDTKVTQLSGGQSRALMIADAAYMSSSPIVLIDEIENAGIDRKQAISLLTENEKIVLISTHDPLLALSADKRIVIKNGGIHKIMETSDEEIESLKDIEKLDTIMLGIRQQLRHGERVYPLKFVL